jgi:hypothetical protein
MSLEAIEKQLRVMLDTDRALGDVQSLTFPMKTDFRKLKASFTCTAEEHQRFICSNYRPTLVGSCTFYGGGSCHCEKEFV